MERKLESWLLEHLDGPGRVVGRGYQAVVREVEADVGKLVVKSPHPNPVLGWFGRRSIRREAEIYDRLTGIRGIPRSFGLAANEHLVLEHVRGSTLREAHAELRDRETFFAELLTTVQAMHAAGVAHGDLKKKENTLIGPDERPRIIDFGVACLQARPGKGLNALRFRLTRQIDLNAYIKLKYGRAGVPAAAPDAALYRPLLIERFARQARKPWQVLTFRQSRKRRRARSE